MQKFLPLDPSPASYTEATQRVDTALQMAGHMHRPVILNDSARTAQEAAQALGVALGQIAKSIMHYFSPQER